MLFVDKGTTYSTQQLFQLVAHRGAVSEIGKWRIYSRK